MNIALFNRKYWVRRFGTTKFVRGYAANGYEDRQVSLHIHPAGENAVSANPEGERRAKRLEGHGTDVLMTSSEATGAKGDLLWYDGEWYECVAATSYDHTVLCHINYQFTLLPKDAALSPDVLAPPGKEMRKHEVDAGEGTI